MALLTGFNVLQIGCGSATAVCGRLLADLGARVTCIDPGAGTMLLDYLNHGKAVAADAAERRKGLAEAHLIVREGQPKDWTTSPYDVAELRRANASATVVTISPYGADRSSGERSGHGPDSVLRQRHFASADRPGRRSGGGADTSRG